MDYFDQLEAAASRSDKQGNASISAQEFLTNEFHYKCTADKEGNVKELILDPPFSKELQSQSAPRNPYFAEQAGSGKPETQELKFTDIYEQTRNDSQKKAVESLDPCN